MSWSRYASAPLSFVCLFSLHSVLATHFMTRSLTHHRSIFIFVYLSLHLPNAPSTPRWYLQAADQTTSGGPARSSLSPSRAHARAASPPPRSRVVQGQWRTPISISISISSTRAARPSESPSHFRLHTDGDTVTYSECEGDLPPRHPPLAPSLPCPSSVGGGRYISFREAKAVDTERKKKEERKKEAPHAAPPPPPLALFWHRVVDRARGVSGEREERKGHLEHRLLRPPSHRVLSGGGRRAGGMFVRSHGVHLEGRRVTCSLR
ncbi:hypothetical protein B0H11DRAFT_1006322 [Mycena galericulata]|nr:hypothetical protein B0H11DRAFT_1006322 [Mycena galericulata]